MKKLISIKKYNMYYIQTAIQKVTEVFYKFPEKNKRRN